MSGTVVIGPAPLRTSCKKAKGFILQKYRENGSILEINCCLSFVICLLAVLVIMVRGKYVICVYSGYLTCQELLTLSSYMVAH